MSKPTQDNSHSPDKQHIAMLIQLGQLQQARELCIKACVHDKRDAEAWFLLGNISARIGDHGEAVKNYSQVISLQPGLPTAHYNLGCAFNQLGQLLPAIQSFRQAIQLKPDFSEALDTLGVVLLKLDQQSEGIRALKQAIRANPNNRSACANLNQAYERVVPRWHFPMLNDEVRNEAYNRALQKVVTSDSIVLDIGTGSGLLSMMAARAGAKHVYTCEGTEIIAEKAREIIARNGFADKITVIPAMSTSIQIGVHLPEKADILVSEIVDVGLLGEGIVDTTRHARSHLLKPNARIIPRGATVFAALIESEQAYQDNHVSIANGFDVSLFNEFASSTYQQKRLENYRYTLLSEPFEVFTFDFCGQPVKPQQRDISFRITQSGTCHAIAMWFQLFLDNEITIDTSDRHNNSCWMQAVQTVDRPIDLLASQTASIHSEHDCKVIQLAAPSVSL